MAGVALVEVVAEDVPPLAAVYERVRLHFPLGELVLVLLVVVEIQDIALRDRAVDRLRQPWFVVRGRRDPKALVRRVVSEGSDDLVSRRAEAGSRQVVAEQVDGGDKRLRLERQKTSRPREVVAVRLRIDLDLAVFDLCVKDVATTAEVDDVQEVDVLAQLFPRQVQTLAHLVDVNWAVDGHPLRRLPQSARV